MASTTDTLTIAQRFTGKVILVTGGAAGIGKAICKRFVREGGTVFVTDVNETGVNAAAEELTGLGPGAAHGLTVDVSDEQQVKDVIDMVISRHGGLDVLINNAARFILKPVEEATAEDWDTVLGVNVKGYAFMAKHAVRAMRNRPGNEHKPSGTSIVNLGSISSFIGQPGMAPYSTTKGAVMQLTKCTAVDLSKYGIRCNAVCPGPILTEATQRHADSQGLTIDDMVNSMTNMMIQPRMGHVDEVASAVAFLASDEASFITGTSLMVDGGYSAL